MKTVKRSVWLAVSVMLAALWALPAAAAGSDPLIGVDPVSFQVCLAADRDATIPDVDITVTVEPGVSVGATDSTLQVYRGPEQVFFKGTANKRSIVLRFRNGDDSISESAARPSDGVNFATGDDKDDEKYIAKTVTLDFSQVKFINEGVYRYLITETAANCTDVTLDAQPQRVLDIYVADIDGALTCVGKILKLEADKPSSTGGVAVSKRAGFTNTLITHRLAVKKCVDGNQGSYDKYFQFTLKLTAPVPANNNSGGEGSGGEGSGGEGSGGEGSGGEGSGGEGSGGEGSSITNAVYPADTPLIVSGQFDQTAFDNRANTYSPDDINAANTFAYNEDTKQLYITLADMKNGKTFYLRHNQTLEIGGIPYGMGYEVTEVPENYDPSASVEGDTDATVKDVKVTDPTLSENAAVTFTNTREGVVPSGVVSSAVLPALVCLMGVVGAGAVLAARRGRHGGITG
ncbi:MAG: hypothetical protein II828_00535 [Clostridia bacterium]|nr:hypothetical protein [Clostridia bacterium]